MRHSRAPTGPRAHSDYSGSLDRPDPPGNYTAFSADQNNPTGSVDYFTSTRMNTPTTANKSAARWRPVDSREVPRQSCPGPPWPRRGSWGRVQGQGKMTIFIAARYMLNPSRNRRIPLSPSRIVCQGLIKGAKIRAAEAIRNQATSARAAAWAWRDNGDHFPKLRCRLNTASAV